MAKKGNGVRSAHGQGSVQESANGKWRWRTPPIKLPSGQRKVFSGTVKTEKEAWVALRRVLTEVEKGRTPELGKITLEDATTMWIKREGISNRMRDLERGLLKRHILPHFGGVLLKDVTPQFLRSAYAKLRDEHSCGQRTREQVHQLLHGALGMAAAEGWLSTNPASVKGVRPAKPKTEQALEEVKAFSESDATKVHQAALAEDTQVGDVLAFLLHTGMRKGEALALRWSDIDRHKKLAHVRGTRSLTDSGVYESAGKTARARRSVPLTPTALHILDRVAGRTEEQRAAFYPDQEASEYVFTNRVGKGFDPHKFNMVMQRICAKAGVVALPPHSLRHTYASLSARAGVRVEVLSKILGHQSPSFTLRQYRTVYADELHAAGFVLPGVTPPPSSIVGTNLQLN